MTYSFGPNVDIDGVVVLEYSNHLGSWRTIFLKEGCNTAYDVNRFDSGVQDPSYSDVSKGWDPAVDAHLSESDDYPEWVVEAGDRAGYEWFSVCKDSYETITPEQARDRVDDFEDRI
ncbi:MAG: hypothetical protein ACODAC_07280 [Pseudomonadota bacterium]